MLQGCFVKPVLNKSIEYLLVEGHFCCELRLPGQLWLMRVFSHGRGTLFGGFFSCILGINKAFCPTYQLAACLHFATFVRFHQAAAALAGFLPAT
jgi:hypothetical protein